MIRPWKAFDAWLNRMGRRWAYTDFEPPAESEETIRRDAEVGFLFGLVEHLTEERDALAAQLRGLGVEPVVDTNWTLITGRRDA